MRKTRYGHEGSLAMKVLMLSHSSSIGGAENVLLQVADGLVRRGHDPLVALPESGRLSERLTASGIPTVATRMRWWAGPRGRSDGSVLAFREGLRDRVRALCRLIERERFDVILTNTGVICEGALAAALTRTPHVWYIHELLSTDPGLEPLLGIGPYTYLVTALSDAVIAVSSAVKGEFNASPYCERVRVIHNAAPTVSASRLDAARSSESVSPRVQRVLYVGTMIPRKGFADLLIAIARLQRNMGGFELWVAGPITGDALQAFDKVRRADGLDLRRVRLFGFVDDVGALMQQCDVVVVPSRVDPFPLVVLEAMAAGKPVVGTLSGGMQEQIVDGVTGILVPPQNPDALSQAIARLLSDPHFAAGLGEAGVVRARTEFTASKMMDQVEATLHAVGSRSKANDEERRALAELMLAMSRDGVTRWVPQLRTLGKGVPLVRRTYNALRWMTWSLRYRSLLGSLHRVS